MIVNVLEARDMPIANKDHASADPYVIVTVHDGYHREQVRARTRTTGASVRACERAERARERAE
jgi:hypothetical protein